MSDISIIEINDDADKIDINNIDVDKKDVDKILTSDDIDDKNDVDKIFTFDDINDEPHNGKPIIMIEISPKENYLITYSKEDRSIVGWNVEDMDKVQLKFDQTVKINEDKGIRSLCVSVFLMIRNLLILVMIINVLLLKSVKIFVNHKDENEFKMYDIGIFSNEKFIFLKFNDKIIVYLIELGIPIASLDVNDDNQLYNFMNHTGLFLLPSLFYYTPDKEIKYCWNNKYKNNCNQTLFEKQKPLMMN
ncbi:hypothetical protein RhiirA5_436297 [Rhizophagus irregularis]|uniref:Uncharacterized protein n=1 Tax=Rhizophagus irregularis TaxID=588596 RepID=A0A2N0NM53_9GLOM|nr:hypothetical protein RhiirA5_436297 [Rhizophagus irregularis]